MTRFALTLAALTLAALTLTPAHAANAPHYYGGRVITHPSLVLVFAGDVAEAGAIDAYVRWLTSGPYFDPAAAYGITGASYAGAFYRPAAEGTIDAWLSWQAPTLPVGPESIVLVVAGAGTPRTAIGYHGVTGSGLVYAFVGLTSAVGSSGIIGHETIEAATDPVPGSGWHVDQTDSTGSPVEIADVCDSYAAAPWDQSRTVAAYLLPDGECVFGSAR